MSKVMTSRYILVCDFSAAAALTGDRSVRLYLVEAGHERETVAVFPEGHGAAAGRYIAAVQPYAGPFPVGPHVNVYMLEVGAGLERCKADAMCYADPGKADADAVAVDAPEDWR